MTTTDSASLSKIPLVFGVVGHRDPRDQDLPALRQALVTLIRSFRQAYPHTPVVLLSALAEGADQVAAEVALDEGCEVRAPLPMPLPFYRQSTSFDDEPPRRMLDDLCGRRQVQSFTVTTPGVTYAAGDPKWQQVANSQDEPWKRERHECYAAAGGYIARHCHVLVAFWDGTSPDPAHPSGTSEHIYFKLLGRPPAVFREKRSAPLGYHGESGPVAVIHTPRRQSEPPLADPAGAVRILIPVGPDRYSQVPAGCGLAGRMSSAQRFFDRCSHALGGSLFDDGGHQHRAHAPRGWQAEYDPDVVKEFQQTCQTLDDYNRDVARDGLPYKADKLAGMTLSAGAPPLLVEALARLNHTRRMAASLASGLQGPLEGDEAGTYGLLFIALVAFDMYAHTFCVEENGHTRHWPLLLGVFALMLLLAAATVMINWWKRTEPRRLDYRALAEALRVRVAWGLAGIGRSVADSYLSQLRSEMSWTRTALLHISPPPNFWSEEFDALPAAEQKARLATIGELWVSEQAAHFAKAHKREHDNAKKFRRMGFGLALLAVAIAVSLFFIPYPHWHWPWCPPGHEHGQAEAVSSVAHPAHWTILLAGVTALVAGFAVAYSERRAFESLASQYDRMQTVFDFAKVEIDRHLENGNVPAAQAVLEEIGHEAIAEHAQWLIARRARPFELHIGG